jgi:hypothetical protein
VIAASRLKSPQASRPEQVGILSLGESPHHLIELKIFHRSEPIKDTLLFER